MRAEALLDGEGYVGSYQSWVRHADERMMALLPQYPGSYQPPVHTLFVAGALALGGHSPLAVKLAQVLLGTLTVWLVYAIGRRALGENGTGPGNGHMWIAFAPFEHIALVECED